MGPASVLGIAMRFAAIGVLTAVVTFASFQWGKNACKAAQERANALIRGRHAETVNNAERAATGRALDRQEKDMDNEERLDEIVRAAEGEAGADDLCLSDDIVSRLRELQ